MQTFVPFPSFSESARTLDRQRLGKQRVEVLQLLRAGLGITTGGWANHPALKMWEGHLCALAGYGMVVCDEWISRGYRDTTRDRILALWAEAKRRGESVSTPSWWGRPDVHESHRSNLVRKMPEHYQELFPDVDPGLDYVWPVTTPRLTDKRKRGTVHPVAAGSPGTHTPDTKEPIVAARNTSRRTKAKAAPVEEPEEDEDDLDLDDVETDDVDVDEDDEVVEPTPAPKAKSRKARKAADEDEAPATPVKAVKGAKAKTATKGKNSGIEAAQAARAANAPKFGTAQVAEYINGELGTSYTPFQLRAILRRMANDENSALSREVGTDRARYDFTGPDDERVQELLERLRKGEIEADKKEQLDKLKARNEAKKGAKAKAKAEPVVEDLDDEDDELEDDDDE